MVDLIQRIDAMRVIEIQSGHIGEDHLAATLDKCRHRRFMLRRPILYDVSGIDIFGFQNIVPADGALPVLFEDSDDTLREVALQIFIIGKAKRFHARLAVRAFFPFGLRRFVTADVEAVVREQCADFCQKLFDKLECFVLTGAENFLKNAAKLAQLCFFAKAT